MKFKLGISTCPNDTFMFDALINKRIDTYGIEFATEFHDIEKLNELALNSCLDITKMSCFSYFNVLEDYVILNSGSALGFGVGPLLVSNDQLQFSESNMTSYKVLLPGLHTTANFLFTQAYPNASNKAFDRFDLIEEAVSNNSFDLGVIIHEGRFTYMKKGLKKICDLGAVWQQNTGLPIPLGCIAIKRSIDTEIKIKVSKLIAKSVQYALNNNETAIDFARQYAQELDDKTIRSHINLYVNEFSVDLGDKGKEALLAMYNFASKPLNKFSAGNTKLFL